MVSYSEKSRRESRGSRQLACEASLDMEDDCEDCEDDIIAVVHD
jgi:hypothetical protein